MKSVKKFHEGLPCNPLAVSESLLWAKVYATAWKIKVYGLHSFLASESSERWIKYRADLSTRTREEEQEAPMTQKGRGEKVGNGFLEEMFSFRSLEGPWGSIQEGPTPC